MNNVLNEANTSHRSWNNLSMQEKAAMIKVAVKNGLTDLKTIREKYNEFAEGGDIYPSEEMNEFGGGGYIYDVLPGMLKKAGLDIRVSSGYRPAGKVGTSGKRSWHWRHGAVDIVPQGRTTFEDIERVVSTNPEIIQYMTANGFGYLDETNRTPEGRALMKKTGATGNHFHFGKDTRARERYQVILGRGNAATLPVTATSEVIAPTAEQPIVPFFMPSNPQVFFSNPVTTNQPVVDMGPTKTPMLEYDPKEAERQEKRDNLNRFNMFLGMLNGSNESTFPFSMFAEGGKIHISPSKKGTFTAAASRHNMGVQEFASKVLANKDDYSSAMVRKANFARNASRWKHGLGGNLFEDGGPKKPLTRDDLRRMLLNRRAEAETAYNGSVTETQIIPNDNAWVDKPLTRRKKNPHSSRGAEEGAKAHAAWEREHPNLAAWGNLAGAVPFAVAAAPLGAGIVAGGDALAATTAGQAITSGLAPLYQAATGTTIAGAPALAWADAGLTSASGAHGFSKWMNGEINGPLDAAMTALEIAPLGRLAKPILNTGIEVLEKYPALYQYPRYAVGKFKYGFDTQLPTLYRKVKNLPKIEDGRVMVSNPRSRFAFDNGYGEESPVITNFTTDAPVRSHSSGNWDRGLTLAFPGKTLLGKNVISTKPSDTFTFGNTISVPVGDVTAFTGRPKEISFLQSSGVKTISSPNAEVFWESGAADLADKIAKARATNAKIFSKRGSGITLLKPKTPVDNFDNYATTIENLARETFRSPTARDYEFMDYVFKPLYRSETIPKIDNFTMQTLDNYPALGEWIGNSERRRYLENPWRWENLMYDPLTPVESEFRKKLNIGLKPEFKK